MISAVVFDCFGVLTTESWLAFKRQYFYDDIDKMQRATEINKLMNSRLMSYDDGLAELAEMAGLSQSEVHVMFRDIAINIELLDYIRDELKPKYKIGMLSNISGSWLHKKFSDKQVELFDGMVLSSDIGVVKPHELAYEAIARRLDVAPQECLFIDDQEINIVGARQAGMEAMLFTDTQACIDELADMLQ